MQNNTKIVILAAGKGTRMKSDLPKVMMEANNMPMIGHIVKKIENLELSAKPIVVVAPDSSLIREYLGDRVDYVVQEEQLGTGHAVLAARDLLEDADSVVVLYGDMPCITSETISELISHHNNQSSNITMTTTIVPDFEDWRIGFYGFGRVVRDVNGGVTEIVERKDASEEELSIKEVNPAQFCFDAKWVLTHLKTLSNDNASHEYYLTEMMEVAFREGVPIESISIDPKEALGANTKEQLEEIEKILSNE